MAKRLAFSVYYDDEDGEAVELRESAAFVAESHLLRADVLQDALFMARRLYDAAADEAFGGNVAAVAHHPV